MPNPKHYLRGKSLFLSGFSPEIKQPEPTKPETERLTTST